MNLRDELLALLEDHDLALYEIQKRFFPNEKVDALIVQMLYDGTLENRGAKLTLSREYKIAQARERVGIKEPRKPFHKPCEDCGADFETKAYNQYRCPLCSKKHKAEYMRDWNIRRNRRLKAKREEAA